MKHLCKYILAFLFFSFVFSCSKDESINRNENEVDISIRSLSPQSIDLNTILSYENYWSHFSKEYKSTVYDNFGDIFYAEGLLMYSNDSTETYVSTVPHIKDSIVGAILLRIEKEDQIFYEGASLFDFEQSCSDLVSKYGSDVLFTLVNAFKAHQYLYNGKFNQKVIDKYNELKNGNYIQNRCGFYSLFFFQFDGCYEYVGYALESGDVGNICFFTLFSQLEVEIECHDPDPDPPYVPPFDPSIDPWFDPILNPVYDPSINPGGSGILPIVDPIFDPNADETCDGRITGFLIDQIDDALETVDYVCDDRPKEEIKDEILEMWCIHIHDDDPSGTDRPKIMTLKDFLAQGDKINYGNLELECKCIYDILVELENSYSSSEENYFCDVVNRIGVQPVFELNFEIVQHSDFETTQNQAAATATMSIPQSVCDGNDSRDELQIATEFLHELIHVDFSEIASASFHLQQNYYDILRTYLKLDQNESIFPVTHIQFFQYLLDDIMNSLWILNGKDGDVSQYAYQAHVLLNTQNLADCISGNGCLDSDGNVVPQPDWVNQLPPEVAQEYIDFDLLSLKPAWESVAGIDGANFDLKCNN